MAARGRENGVQDLCPGKEREDVERTEDPIRRHPRFLCLSTVEEGVLGGLGGSSAGLARLRRSDVMLGAVAERKGAVKEAEERVIPLPLRVIGVGGPPDSGPAQVGRIWVHERLGRMGAGANHSDRGLSQTCDCVVLKINEMLFQTTRSIFSKDNLARRYVSQSNKGEMATFFILF